MGHGITPPVNSQVSNVETVQADVKLKADGTCAVQQMI
jgi:hypothetical protein